MGPSCNFVMRGAMAMAVLAGTLASFWAILAPLEALGILSGPETSGGGTPASGRFLEPELRAAYFDKHADDVIVEYFFSSPADRTAFDAAASTLVADVWTAEPAAAQVRLRADALRDFDGLLPQQVAANKRIVLDDVRRAVVNSVPLRPSRSVLGSDFASPTQLTELLAEHNGLPVGISWDGEPIRALGASPIDGHILVVCGLHGREWASTAYCLHLAAQNLPNVTVIPVANPDGYAHSWNTDRLWVKNRQPSGLVLCPGHDLARALFGNYADSEGSVTPCSDSWTGRGAQAPLEARSLASFAAQYSRKIAVHGLSQTAQADKQDHNGWEVVRVPDYGTGFLLPKRLIDSSNEELDRVMDLS